MASTRAVELFDEFTELIRSFIVRREVTRTEYAAIMNYVISVGKAGEWPLWLDAFFESTVDSRPYGVLGFCLGGSFALLTAATHPNQVTVTYCAFPKGASGAKVPVTEPLQVADAITGPVLAHWGRRDYIDAGEIGQLAKALAEAPGTADVRWYEHAGHAFLAGLTDPGHEGRRRSGRLVVAHAAVLPGASRLRLRPVSTAGALPPTRQKGSTT